MKTTTFGLIIRHALAAGVALVSTSTLAYGATQVSMGEHTMTMDHSHCTAMAAAARTAGYKQSLRTYSAIPDVVLTDAEGNPVRLRELLAGNEPVMLNFIFTTCTTICPVMTKVFADVRTRLGHEADNLRMVSISIDPENDTPARLAAYGQRFGADSHWTFLTGRAQDIAAVQRAFDTYDRDKMNHQPLTLLRAGAGRQWVRIEGFATADQLADEYRNTSARHGAEDGRASL